MVVIEFGIGVVNWCKVGIGLWIELKSLIVVGILFL